MYKIIFFDADGTLFSHKTNSINPTTIEAILKAKQKGYLIALATGRSKILTAQLGLFEKIKFDYFVTINGTLVLNKENQIIYQKPIPQNEVHKIIDITEKHKLNLALISQDDYYLLRPKDKRCHLAYDPLHITIPQVKKYNGEDIFQINLFCEDEYLPLYQDTLQSLSYSKLDDYGYDIFCSKQSKAVGIKHLLDYLKIDRQQAMAFGDGHNDQEMISYVGMGIAMGNAITKVKKVSRYITDDIDDDGIKKALLHFQIIEEEK